MIFFPFCNIFSWHQTAEIVVNYSSWSQQFLDKSLHFYFSVHIVPTLRIYLHRKQNVQSMLLSHIKIANINKKGNFEGALKNSFGQ